MKKLAVFVKEWKLFGFLSIWKIERSLDEKELLDRTECLIKKFFDANRDDALAQVKESVLEEINLALNGPPAKDTNE